MRLVVWFCFGLWVGGVLFLPDVGLEQADAGTKTPLKVKETSERAVTTAVETQKLVDQWTVEEERLLEDIEQKERMLERLTWEQKKHSEYLETLESKVVEMREKAAEMERIHAELLPILDEGLERLAAFEETDIPFDKTRRLKRLEDTARALNDYDVGLLAKAQALLDAVIHAVTFGYEVDSEEAEVDIQGRPTRVKLLKVGRLGLYALSMDGEKAYVWNPRENRYVPVPARVRDIDEAIDIVERIRIIELTRLPMGRPDAISPTGGRPHE